MLFNSQELGKMLQQPLPGILSQLKMAPASRAVQYADQHDKRHLAVQSAVLILIFPDPENLKLILIRRSEYNGFHSNQMAFPGGKYEMHDADFEATALRETEEEIGVKSDKIEILGQLTDLFIPPSNFLIKTFVGFCKVKPDFTINKNEVQSVVEIDLNEFFKPENKGEKYFYAGALGAEVAAPYFKVSNVEIWGATAMIVSELLDILNTEKL